MTYFFDRDEGQLVTGGDPNPALLVTGCVGCHLGVNSAGSMPYVLSLEEPDYGLTGTGGNTRAAGSFYWVAHGQDRKGHNVTGLADWDRQHGYTPPGGTVLPAQLTCAGAAGCHGSPEVATPATALQGSHHQEKSGWRDGGTVATSYRLLQGVQGLGDPSFEWQPSASQRNKYYGYHRSGSSDPAPDTISGFCARCHGDFHQATGDGSPWLRHPVDFDLSQGEPLEEYLGYNGGDGTANPYNVAVPLATADTSDQVPATIEISAGDQAVVMCLSCHRAHGSPVDAMLRWDYKSWPANGYNGCGVCHSSKN